jgi:hypothetical protein
MNVLDAEILPLPRTATYARREAVFTPNGREGEGTLDITLWKGLRAGSKPERDKYTVEETNCVGRMGRCFLLKNETDEPPADLTALLRDGVTDADDEADIYATTIGPTCHCTCKCGLVGRHECKHVSAVRAAIVAGLL